MNKDKLNKNLKEIKKQGIKGVKVEISDNLNVLNEEEKNFIQEQSLKMSPQLINIMFNLKLNIKLRYYDCDNKNDYYFFLCVLKKMLLELDLKELKLEKPMIKKLNGSLTYENLTTLTHDCHINGSLTYENLTTLTHDCHMTEKIKEEFNLKMSKEIVSNIKDLHLNLKLRYVNCTNEDDYFYFRFLLKVTLDSIEKSI